jgi:purine nucleosidase
MESDLADFFLRTTESLRDNAREQGLSGPAMPDSLAAACLAYPSLRETVATVDATVDNREGLTRGFLSVDREASEAGDGPVTRVVEAVDAGRYRAAHLAMLADRDPDAPF